MNLLMRLITVMCFLPLSALSADITNISGKRFSDVTVQRIEPDGISIKHSGGVIKLFVSELPPDVLKQYGLNAESAQKYQAAKNEAIRNREAQLRDNIARKNAELELMKSSYPMDINVLSVTREGLLGYKCFMAPVIIDGKLTRRYKESDTLVFVYCNSSGYYDGKKWKGTVVPFGTYNYDSAMGASRTVEAYKHIGP